MGTNTRNIFARANAQQKIIQENMSSSETPTKKLNFLIRSTGHKHKQYICKGQRKAKNHSREEIYLKWASRNNQKTKWVLQQQSGAEGESYGHKHSKYFCKDQRTAKDHSREQIYLPYAGRYNPRFVYFLPTF